MSFRVAYKLVVRNTAGTKVGEIDDFTSLSYTRKVNSPGVCEFTLNGENTKIALFGRRVQVEVHRREQGGSFTPDFYGFWGWYRYRHQNGFDTYTATCPGQMMLLAERAVLWHPGTDNRSRFSAIPGETIMKTLVTYNCTSSASTANGRIRAGTITGLSVEADGADGTALTTNVEWANLLKVLQDLAPQAGGDFDLVKTGAAAWEFRWYGGQLGTDRTTGSSAVLFALERENMADPELIVDRAGERTVAVVGGIGNDVNRVMATRTGAEYHVDTANSEVFVNAGSTQLTGALNWRGDVELNKLRARPKLTFTPVQTPTARYGTHYFLGDRISASYRDFSATQKITGVTITWSREQGESIKLDLEDV